MPNNDYILRSDALKAARYYKNRREENHVPSIDDVHLTEYQLLAQAINSIPAADVEGKRMEGIWIEQPESLNDRNDKIYRCSVCGYADEQSPTAEVPYCWHCGSKMKREVK